VDPDANGVFRYATLCELLEDRARCRPGKVMGAFEDREVRYGEFNSAVDRVAASLHELGVRHGDRVIATLPNGLDMLYLYFAVAKLGAANVFINPEYDAGLFNRLVKALQPAAVVLDEINMAKLRAGPSDAVRIRWPGGEEGFPGEISFARLLKGDATRIPKVRIEPGDAVQYIFTSGTTGLPKACILSHCARLALCEQINRSLEATDEDRFFGCLPNYHGNVFLAILGGMLAGGSFALAERFSASRYWDQARRFHATILVLHLVPLNVLLKAAPRSDDSWHPARAVLTVGGKPGEFLRRFGLNTALVGYGSTEAGGLTALGAISRWQAPDIPSSYSGRVRDDLEVRIMRDDGERARAGEAGEIYVRPRIPFVMFNGYHGADGHVVSPPEQSWHRTGDLGSIDPADNLHFHGRATDAVRVKGEFVPIEYLESLIREHEAIEECAVMGVRSDVGDEDLVVYVKTKAPGSLSQDDVIDYLSPRVPRFMVPQIVEFVADFPRTAATMKIQKSKLRAP
jgi:acyl-coenzyme A synthetase/AMP-(fatty) acid ligase